MDKHFWKGEGKNENSEKCLTAILESHDVDPEKAKDRDTWQHRYKTKVRTVCYNRYAPRKRAYEPADLTERNQTLEVEKLRLLGLIAQLQQDKAKLQLENDHLRNEIDLLRDYNSRNMSA